MAASIHEGEDAIVLEAFAQIKQQFNEALLILVPRHPERFDKVAELVTKQGFSMARRSQQQAAMPNVDVFLADSMGELLFMVSGG
ncbi:MAG: hypothetical protein V9G29_14615 [Burkholderiaceae bacterium]